MTGYTGWSVGLPNTLCRLLLAPIRRGGDDSASDRVARIARMISTPDSQAAPVGPALTQVTFLRSWSARNSTLGYVALPIPVARVR